jgi:carboxyl-terminal processing protease
VENQPNNPFYQPFLYALVLILGMFFGFKVASNYFSQSHFLSTQKEKTQLDYLITLLKDQYVDSLNTETLFENGVEGIISTLDPHTVYIPASETDRVNEELEGNIFGIGIEFFIYQDTIHVISILENSPAKNADIDPGDIILKIDDSLVAGKQIDEEKVIQLIKGKRNTLVHLKIQKPDGKINTLDLERETITYNSIIASYILPHQKDIGYIAIRMFSENTYTEFKQALQRLVDRKISKLIIDVRNNPGGYMDAVTSILDEMVAGNHILLKTKSKSNTEEVKSEVTGLFETGKVCILINENSASASEILAGSIQDLDRGTIIGRRSYGKGLVQEQFTLPNKAAIRITVARYYLPSGRCIQKDYSKGKNVYQNEIYERAIQDRVSQKDTAKELSKMKYYTAKRRVVYGGEGVQPDILVENDYVVNQTLETIHYNNIVELFAANYYYLHKNDFVNYDNEVQFEKEFQPTPNISNKLLNYLGIHVKSFNHSLFAGIQTKVFATLKSEFAKLRFDNNAKYMVLSNDDEMVKKAVEILSR